MCIPFFSGAAMKSYQTFSLREIQDHLENGDLPLSGTTQLGSAEFHFLKPSWYAGIAIHAGSNERKGTSVLFFYFD
jgi:hypothetical protein